MSIKKNLIAGVITLGVSMPLFAQAADLHITNNTKRDSTVITNNGPCSTILGETGITRAGKQNTVSESKIATACMLSIYKGTDCEADVFMTDHCNVGDRSIKPIAKVYFDIQKKDGKIVGTGLRLEKTIIYDTSYAVGGSGFDLAINGGPAMVVQK